MGCPRCQTGGHRNARKRQAVTAAAVLGNFIRESAGASAQIGNQPKARPDARADRSINPALTKPEDESLPPVRARPGFQELELRA